MGKIDGELDSKDAEMISFTFRIPKHLKIKIERLAERKMSTDSQITREAIGLGIVQLK